MAKPDFTSILAQQLKSCRNPVDLKPAITGTVAQLDPVVISINEGAILLTEGVELYISEFFRLRCKIDETGALSSDVPSSLESAQSVTEIHSYTGTACTMPDAIAYLASAIESVNNELLNLKCTLSIGDYVVLASLEQTDAYLLIDKVLT